jgi:hypothetical protein
MGSDQIGVIVDEREREREREREGGRMKVQKRIT